MIDGKRYYGAHKTNNINDGYLGSGKYIRRAIQHHGKENFKRIILKEFPDEESMYAYENVMIDQAMVDDPMTYNLTIGGRGGFSHIDNSGDRNVMRNPEIARKNVESCRANGSYYSEARKCSQKLATESATIHNTGKTRPDHAALMKQLAKERGWAPPKPKASTFKITAPDGTIYVTNELQKWCKERSLPYTTIWGNYEEDRPIKKGRAKGWRCIKVTND